MRSRCDYTAEYIGRFFDGYEALSNAVVTRAAFDYREYVAKMVEIENKVDAMEPFELKKLKGRAEFEELVRSVYENNFDLEGLKKHMQFINKEIKYGDQDDPDLKDELCHLKHWTRVKIRLVRAYDGLNDSLREVEDFFEGDEIMLYTGLDGLVLLTKLRQEMAA